MPTKVIFAAPPPISEKTTGQACGAAKLTEINCSPSSRWARGWAMARGRQTGSQLGTAGGRKQGRGGGGGGGSGPCLPFFFRESLQDSLSQRWASNRPVHRCLPTTANSLQLESTRNRRGNEEQSQVTTSSRPGRPSCAATATPSERSSSSSSPSSTRRRRFRRWQCYWRSLCCRRCCRCCLPGTWEPSSP